MLFVPLVIVPLNTLPLLLVYVINSVPIKIVPEEGKLAALVKVISSVELELVIAPFNVVSLVIEL